jgi:hypothetical protein
MNESTSASSGERTECIKGVLYTTTQAVISNESVETGVRYFKADSLLGQANGIAKKQHASIDTVLAMLSPVASPSAGMKSPRNTKYAITTPWPNMIVIKSSKGPAYPKSKEWANNSP